MKYYDIGLNLFCRQFPDPDAIMRGAEAAGVRCILTGSDARENALVDEWTRTHPGVWGTAGIHPHNADRASAEDFAAIRRMLRENPAIVAVGECGLDWNRMFSTRENQLRCLEEHLAIAEETGKPLFLHEREAAADFTAVFRSHPNLCRRAVVHCFTGDRATIETYLDMGFHIGITGWICDDRRAGDLREAVKSLPLDRLMLETDAPYLTPRVRGLSRVNVPENIRYVASGLAACMGVEEDVLIRAARANTERFFRLNPTDTEMELPE
ncbi:MAG: TatD family hydrolase [Clostridia bacterium]|nr:TatD family hydrolase [Clostridia bacterium]